MKKLTFKGFTLIELLVVIAIIALLASIILALLNSARSKGRDANRVQSLQEMAKSISLLDTDPAPTLTGCTDAADVIGCTSPNLSAYKDPSTPGTACTKASTGTCQYAIFKDGGTNITTQNYLICTWLENGLNGGVPALYSVSSSTSSGVIKGCV